jgi:IS30 family transposase/DNA-binding transcriptional LysR family regulator
VGSLVIEQVRSLITAADEIERNLRLFGKGEAGRISIGLGTLLASLLLPSLSRSLLQARPNIQIITVVEPPEQLLTELINTNIEMIIGSSRLITDISGVAVERLGALKLTVVVRSGHPLVGRRDLKPSDLADFPIAKPRGFPSENVNGRGGAFICDNFHILRDTVLCTDSIALFSPAFVSDESQDGRLKILNTEGVHIASNNEICTITKTGSTISPIGSPPERTRGRQALGLADREEISRGLSVKKSLRGIAGQLGRALSTISREIRCNGGAANYRATISDKATWDRALRPKAFKLACYPALSCAVSAKLQRKWSPEQIASWLNRLFPREPKRQVSHETIYKSQYIQTYGVLKNELLEHLRAQRTIRRSWHASLKRNGKGQIKNAVSISERPASVEDRAVPGHWEGDLIGGAKNSYIATLVERQSRYVMLVKVANKDTKSVVSALIKQSQRLPRELYRSLTWDRGKELADHPRLTLATHVEVYFCDPQYPWQRGTNENINRLLRQ